MTKLSRCESKTELSGDNSNANTNARVFQITSRQVSFLFIANETRIQSTEETPPRRNKHENTIMNVKPTQTNNSGQRFADDSVRLLGRGITTAYTRQAGRQAARPKQHRKRISGLGRLLSVYAAQNVVKFHVLHL